MVGGRGWGWKLALNRAMCLHIRVQDGIDAGLLAALLAEPAKQVGVEPHGHDFFSRRHRDRGALPKRGTRGMGVGIRPQSLCECGQHSCGATCSSQHLRQASGVSASPLLG